MVQTTPGEFERSQELIGIGPHVMAALDLDRAMILSDNLSRITYDSLSIGADEAVIAAIDRVRHKEIQEKGNSFPYLEELQKELGEEIGVSSDDLARQVADVNRDKNGGLTQEFIEKIMVDGAVEYIQKLEACGAGWLIMTAGQPVTQRYKIALIKIILAEHGIATDELSYMITDPDAAHGKAVMIDSVYDQETGEFDLSQLFAQVGDNGSLSGALAARHCTKVILTDDKEENIKGAEHNQNLIARRVWADNKPNTGQSKSAVTRRLYQEEQEKVI